MAEEYPELFSYPQEFDRLRLYSIAYDMRELLAFPPAGPMQSLSPHHPLRRMERTLDGLSHLDRLAGNIEADPMALDPGEPIIKGFDTPVPSAPLLAY